jgi:tetratricopeptide (TPR) repeat protein
MSSSANSNNVKKQTPVNQMPSKQMTDAQLERFCKAGAQADHALAQGSYRDALAAYKMILSDIEKTGQLDSYLLAKVTLGSLRCHIKLGEFQKAIEIWNAHMDESLYGIGIYALENAQTKIEDLIVYDMLCAFLHSMVDGDKHQTAKAVNLYLSRVCEHAEEIGERALMVQALANWKSHLKEIYGGSIPHESAQELIRFEQAFGETVKPRPIDFPLPSSWERPNSFRETSTVVSKRALHSRAKRRA